MKKSSLILIAIIYIASVVVISVFGMSSVVYNEIIPVTSIQCLNKTTESVVVKETDNGIKEIKLKFINAEETELILEIRALPDEATNKSVKFIYNKNRTDFEFVKNDFGVELPVIKFKKKTFLSLRVMATDGTGVFTDIEINVY